MGALPSSAGALWQPLGEFTVLLYPFINGRNGYAAGLTDAHRREYGAMLKRLHATQLPADLAAQLPRENFIPIWAQGVREQQMLVRAGLFTDPFQIELGAFWREHAAEIMRLVERAEELGRALADARALLQ